MKITQKRIKEIIREEIQSIKSEGRKVADLVMILKHSKKNTPLNLVN